MGEVVLRRRDQMLRPVRVGHVGLYRYGLDAMGGLKRRSQIGRGFRRRVGRVIQDEGDTFGGKLFGNCCTDP